MKRIPNEILLLFKKEHFSAEESLLTWLLDAKVEELDCSKLGLHPIQIIRIASVVAKSQIQSIDLSNNHLRQYGPATAKHLTGEHSKVLSVNLSGNHLREHGPATAKNLTGERSKVQSVDLSWNFLGEHGLATAKHLTGEHSKVQSVNLRGDLFGEYGPAIAKNLTGEHSRVQSVDLSYNYLRQYGPETAKNLTGEHSKVQSVDFAENELHEYGPETAKNLTGEHSKVLSVNLRVNDYDANDPAVIKYFTGKFSTIISAAGINLTQAQLKNNAMNILIKSNYPNKELSSLTALAAKATYQTLLAKSSPASLPEMINEIQQNHVLDFAVKGLLLQYNALTLDDIAKGKEDECVKKYIEVHIYGAEASLIASRQIKPA